MIGKKGYGLMCLLAIVSLFMLFLYPMLIEMREPHRNKIHSSLESYSGDYVITFQSMEKRVPLLLSSYCLKSKHEDLMQEPLVNIYETNPDFLDENLTRIGSSVIFHDNDGDWNVSENDTIVIKSKRNGGVAEAGMTFSLRCYTQVTTGVFFESLLKDDILERITIPHRDFSGLNTLKVNDSSFTENKSVLISEDHKVFSSFFATRRGVDNLKMGITLLNNASERIENISVVISDKTVLKQIDLIKLDVQEQRRIVFPISLGKYNGNLLLTIEVILNNTQNLLTAEVTIFQGGHAL